MNQSSFLRETSLGISHISIYDRLLQDRSIMFTDEVNPESANELISHLIALELEDGTLPITLYINSPGGEVNSGLAVYDVIMNLSVPVNTVCIGMAASMASVIFLAGRKRSMYEHTKIMIHDPILTGLSGSKRALELEKEAERLMETRKLIGSIIAERTGNPLKKVLDKTKEDCYMDASEAIKFGIATEVIGNNTKEGERIL